jgi:uncharacterized protein
MSNLVPHLIKFAPRGQSEIKQYTVQEFQTATGVTYLPALEFEDLPTLEAVRKKCARAVEKGTVGRQSRWLGVLHAEEIRNNFVADVSIRWIDETFGYGLFAEQDLSTGQYIGEYTGVVRKCNLIIERINEYCFAYPTNAMSFQKHIIDACEKGNETRYANHSDDNNCESMGVWCDGIFHIIIRAIRDISAGSQLTYDYSGLYWLSQSEILIPPERL